MSDNRRTPTVLWFCALALGIAGAHSASLSAPFHYDDLPAIRDNPSIRQLSDLSLVLQPPAETPMTGRPVVNLSLAANYAINEQLGVEPNGPHATTIFHATNVLLHVLCAFVVFLLVRVTAEYAGSQQSWVEPQTLAGSTSLLWAVHPIHIDAVAYLTQRTEVIASLFLLITIYATARGHSSPRRAQWYVLGVISCALGMLSKETVAVAPFLVLAYDRAFLSTSWREPWRDKSRAAYHGALIACLTIVAATMALGARGPSVGFNLGITWYEYLYSQAWAIARYVRLMLWPNGFIFDYGERAIRGLGGVPGAVLLTLALAATVAAWRTARWRGLAFLGAWFFLILGPSSSIVPIRTEIGAERRMYLPSLSVVVLIVIGVTWLRQRNQWRPLATRTAFVVAVAALALLTFARGRVFSDPELLYRDQVSAAPWNARGHVSLALAIAAKDPTRLRESTAAAAKATKVDSQYFVAWRTLGVLELMQSNYRAALPALERAHAIQPGNADVVVSLARAHIALRDADQAIPYVDEVGRLVPELPWSLGALLIDQGRGDVALRYLRLAAADGAPPARGMALMAVAFAQTRKAEESVLAAKWATDHGAGEATVFEIAGRAMEMIGRRIDASNYYRRALALDSTSAAARRFLRSR
jgi:tetratricopeptide (TPR) repeat protein